MLIFIFSCLWYLLPAALGNHNASCGNRLPLPGILKKGLARLAVPIDFGVKWHGNEIVGKNKTWRGIIVGIVTGILVAGAQAILYFNVSFFRENTLVDYGKINFIVIGALMGGGALLGDLLESFIKRRLNKPSGKPWFPWDQMDWIIGAILLSSIVYVPPFKVAITTILLYVVVHLCSDRVVCWMGIKKREEVI
ncbi:MAG: CDP-archaeol synthase [Candidatus Omnitrophica bacterium]|nr:CDP-archaeol synthase [Candidatus Omnitrophota bacterium]